MEGFINDALIGDLVLLEDVSDKGIEKVLKDRIAGDHVYTYIGNVLISVNPFKKVRGLYSPDLIPKYRHRFAHEAPPHIFAVSEVAYRQLPSGPQCAIITGESGSGKTEASKKIMQYIADVVDSRSSSEIERVKDRLLKSNPVLEAFGNAKTLRNNNSSRFGKYLEIFFDFKGDPIGGKVQNYLLEKIRVVHPGSGERSFHIFYQLVKGATAEMRQKYILKNHPKEYQFLNQSGMFNLSEDEKERDEDLSEFRDMMEGMKSLGISDKETDEVFATVSAILWLGEIEFGKNPKDGMSVIENTSSVALDNIAVLLNIPREVLNNCFTQREIQLEKDLVARHHRVDEAMYARDSLAKTIYFRLFDWIVEKVNLAIAPGQHTISSSIGVLDIYGFEIFKWNSFEQFCINYVNEKLQQIFIERTLKLEQEEYSQENILWTSIEYFNNKVVCELIEGKSNGILVLLNECCLIPKGTDELFHEKLLEKFSSHQHFAKPNVKQSKTCFTIKHYAGEVEYETPGFLDKNRDLVWKNLIAFGESSSLSIFQRMFTKGEAAEMGLKRPVTASTHFKEQVENLMETLAKCTPHYVRCIKPNDVKKSGVWDSDRVLHQIRYLGLLENVKVRRAGFAFRQTFQDFLRRYKMVCPRTWPEYDSKHVDRGCAAIMAEMKVEVGPAGYQLGKSKIFIKEPKTLFALERRRNERVNQLNMIITAHARAKNFRVFFREYCASRLLQKQWRCKIGRDYIKEYRAARTIQAVTRTFQQALFLKRHRAARSIQALVRGRNQHVQFQGHLALRKIQAIVRGKQKRDWLEKYRAARSIQSICRGDLVRKRMEQFRSVLIIQRAYRYFQSRRPALRTKSIFVNSEITPYKNRRRCSINLYPARLYQQQFLSNQLVLRLMHSTGDSRVLFADNVIKYGNKFKPKHRVLVVTNLAVFDFDWSPRKKITENQFKLHHRFLVHSITGISLSTKHDNVIVLHMPSQYDIAYALDRKVELAAIIAEQFFHINKRLLPINVRDSITFLYKDGQIRTIQFEEVEKPTGSVEKEYSPAQGLVLKFDRAKDTAIAFIPKSSEIASFSKGEKNLSDEEMLFRSTVTKSSMVPYNSRNKPLLLTPSL